jgi:hypothetical protein
MIGRLKSAWRGLMGKPPDPWDAVNARYTASMALIREGWKPWLSPVGLRPWDYAVIEIRRLDGPVIITAAEDIRKETNGVGLFWRPWNGEPRDGGGAA